MPAFTPGPAPASCCPACGYPTLNASLCHVCSPFAAQLGRTSPSTGPAPGGVAPGLSGWAS